MAECTTSKCSTGRIVKDLPAGNCHGNVSFLPRFAKWQFPFFFLFSLLLKLLFSSCHFFFLPLFVLLTMTKIIGLPPHQPAPCSAPASFLSGGVERAVPPASLGGPTPFTCSPPLERTVFLDRCAIPKSWSVSVVRPGCVAAVAVRDRLRRLPQGWGSCRVREPAQR